MDDDPLPEGVAVGGFRATQDGAEKRQRNAERCADGVEKKDNR